MYDRLLQEAESRGIEIYEKPMTPRIKGLYGDGVIWLNRGLPTSADKACILAEELGHYHTTVGDILDQSTVPNRKQERRAREWAYHRLVSLPRIIEACQAGVRGRHELAEYLGVTEEFLQATINRYIDKLGPYAQVDKRYTIIFEPLSVAEIFAAE